MDNNHQSETRIKTLHADNFSAALQNASRGLVVYFFAPWCQPCKLMRPIFVQLIAQPSMSDIFFGEVNIAVSPTIAPSYGVRSVPSILVFHHQKAAPPIAGTMPLPDLMQQVQDRLI